MPSSRDAAQWRRPTIVAAALVIIAAIACAVVWRARGAGDERALLTAANALNARLVDGRVAFPIEHRPVRGARQQTDTDALTDLAAGLERRWRAESSIDQGRLAGAALLLSGHSAPAAAVLSDALTLATGKGAPLDAIRACRDARLLIDYSAAMLTRKDARSLLLALEAADAANRLQPGAPAAWNRALAADRLGFRQASAASWRKAARDHDPQWSQEAARRLAEGAKSSHTEKRPSPEIFFHEELISIAHAMLRGEAGANENVRVVIAGDVLARDAIDAISRTPPAARASTMAALDAFARGRAAFLDGRPHDALPELMRAERELAGNHNPLALIARDQRIRTQCWLGAATCLNDLRSLRAELDRAGRYPWLAARVASAEGQANYRAGRIYDAVEAMEHAHAEFKRVHDPPSVSYIDSLLGNAYAAAGETEVALAHYLAAIAVPAQNITDRRRKQLEDPLMFMLRQGYVTAAEAILDELTSAPATPEAAVMESTLRGVIAVRRGQMPAATAHFDRARAQLNGVQDATSRAEVHRALAIAQAGSGTAPASVDLDALDAAVSADQQDEVSIWLPQLLTQRGAAFEKRHDDAQAERDYRRAMAILEARQPRIDQTMLALGVTYNGESPFDGAIRLLLRQGRFSEALTIAQRAAALRISSLYARTAGVPDVFAAARRPAGDAVAAIRGTLRASESAVAYHLLRDELVTWLVTRDEVVVSRRSCARDEFIAMVARLRDCTARGDCKDDAAVNRTSQLLVQDWIERVPRDATLLVQQPPDMDALPFPMLLTRTGERLLQRNAIATAPSLHAFVEAARIDREKRGPLDAFFAAAPRPGGDRAPLPAAVAEVTRASQSHAGAVVDIDATRERFLDRAPAFGIVHFAGHVIVNDDQPLMSALVFDPDANGGAQMLHLHELAARSFERARLVVLAACETGRAPRPTISIANALISQEVPSVVYTLWSVDDEAAADFAIAFHRGLATGRTRVEAVREAALALYQANPDRADAWAAFALAGEPGALDMNEKPRKGDLR